MEGLKERRAVRELAEEAREATPWAVEEVMEAAWMTAAACGFWGSILQSLEQPSLLRLFLSSHCSGGSMKPFPQKVTHRSSLIT